MISVEQSCPPVNFPAFTPPCSFIATQLQCFLCGIEKRRSIGRYLPPGVKAEQMRCMPVAGIRFFEFFVPFQQLPFAANTHCIQFLSFFKEHLPECSVDMENFRCLDQISEQVPND